MEPTLIYQPESQTLRQIPQNYLIAHFDGHKWLCEPDLAADRGLATRVFKTLFEFDLVYKNDGQAILNKIPSTEEFIKEFIGYKGLKEDIIAVMDSCVEGYTGKWDPTGEGKGGFCDMLGILERIAKHFGVDTSGALQFVEGNLDMPKEEWLHKLFEFEFCEECGGDAIHHNAIPLNGNWFARCLYPKTDDGEMNPLIKSYRDGYEKATKEAGK